MSKRSLVDLPYHFTDYVGEVLATVVLVLVVLCAILANIAQAYRHLSFYGISFYFVQFEHPQFLTYYPVLLVVGYAILTALSQAPQIYVSPKPIMTENAPRHYRLIRGAVIWSKAVLCAAYTPIFLYLAFQKYPPQNPMGIMIMILMPLLFLAFIQLFVLVRLYQIK